MTMLQQMEPQLTSRRSLLNRHYMVRALNLLGNADPSGTRYRWLVGTDAPLGTSSRQGGARMVLLTELGRTEDDAVLCDVAEQLCQAQPPTSRAVAVIRAVRGVRRKPRRAGLVTELIAVVDDYRMRYPEVSWAELAEAATVLRDMLAEMPRDEED